MTTYSMNPTSLTILATNIRRDDDGRYCLNDCHRAAGGDESKSPNRFARSESYKALVSELTPDLAFAPSSTQKGGANPGTYAVKELVYAYAMWISPAFHLTVIRAFDAQVIGIVQPKTPPVPASFREALLLAADQQAQIEAQERELAIAAPKAEALDRIADTSGRTNLREVGKVLGIGSKRGIDLVREMGWIFRSQSGKWNAYSGKVDAGLVDVKYTTYTNTAGEEVSTQQVFVTPKGMVALSVKLGKN